MDLIDRQAAIDAMNKRARDTFTLASEYQYYLGALHDVADDINQLPSAQPYTTEEIQKIQELEQAELDKAFRLGREDALSEIVRCKDCKHQEKYFHADGRRKDGGYYIFGCGLADGYSHVCLDDDFCSRAERQEE